MPGKRSSRRRAKQSKSTGCLSGCLSAIFELIGALAKALVVVIVGFFQLLVSIVKWLSQQKVTLPIGKGYQVSGLFLAFFLGSLCMCCSIGYAWADIQLRAIGILPTYTPHPTTTHTLTPTGTSAPTEMPPPTDTLTPSPLPTETPLPTYTPVPSQPTAKVTAPTLNVRAGPGTDYPAVGKLSQGDSVEVMGRNAAGDWLQIVYPVDSEGRAWIATAYIELTGSLIGLPEVAATPLPEPTSAPLPVGTLIPPADTPTVAPMPTDTPYIAPTNTPIPTAKPTATTPRIVPTNTPRPGGGTCPSGSFAASRESNKYHYPSCRWAEKILPENLICFGSVEEARAAGYEPCGVCTPPW